MNISELALEGNEPKRKHSNIDLTYSGIKVLISLNVDLCKQASQTGWAYHYPWFVGIKALPGCHRFPTLYYAVTELFHF